jgi:Tol biopolymer transport system component
MTRIFVVAIDAASEDMIFEQPGYWTPMDWSPDGKKLLLTHGEIISMKMGLMSNILVELDMATVEKMLTHPRRNTFGRWQNYDTTELLEPVLGDAAAVSPNGARYSPDGKFIAVTAIRKAEKPGGGWKALDFELGVIDRARATYQKVVWYKDGLRGPICWSPDGAEILFSRPLEPGDKREASKEEDNGLGLWAIKSDGSGARFLTTGWSPDWR